MRGMNSAHIWWDNWNRNFAFNSLPTISLAGFNTVRIVWQIKTDGGLDNNYLEKIIQTVIQYQMIPMVELHDATGSTNEQDLYACARWFRDNISLFNKYSKYVLINIANEWVNKKIWKNFVIF
jgi:mannan endo-1,4-beta-mannosidase